ncbi:hypothetical protein SDC9_173008 [bioreactor metagenome]|uniref:Uncharacterized protein n=1 Tax=bioreactor metagenome TaxID=1076179 RepID=A0A645GHD7_9ZZZZ
MVVFVQAQRLPQSADKILDSRQHFPGIDGFQKQILCQRGGKIRKHIVIFHAASSSFVVRVAYFVLV